MISFDSCCASKWNEFHINPSKNHTVILFKNITSKKQAEEAIEKQKKKIVFLSEAANHHLNKQNPKELLDSLFQEIAVYLDVDVYFNYLFNDDNQRLELLNYQGIPASIAEEIRYLDLGEAVCGCVARNRFKIIEENIEGSVASSVKLVKELGIKAFALSSTYFIRETNRNPFIWFKYPFFPRTSIFFFGLSLVKVTTYFLKGLKKRFTNHMVVDIITIVSEKF